MAEPAAVDNLSAVLEPAGSEEDEIVPTVIVYREGIRIITERANSFTGWSAASVKTMLVTANYVPSQTHTSKADAASYEIQGGDYTPGGQFLGSKTVTTVNNQLRLDAADVSWSNIIVKPRYALVYDDTNATVTQKTLFAYMDLGNIKARKLRLKWPSTGVIVLTVEDAIGLP